MQRNVVGSSAVRLAIAALVAMSLLVVAPVTVPPTSHTAAVALDSKDDESGNVDENDDKENGNGKDNPGKGKGKDKRKGDDEEAIATAVPTATLVPSATFVPTATLVPATMIPTQVAATQSEPTQLVLTPVTTATASGSTPVSSASRTVSTPVTTGTLTVSLRRCPAGIDATGGAAALADACPDAESDAVFELAGRSGLFAGWRRDLTTGADGKAKAPKVAEGRYALTLVDLDWCAAESSNVADGLVKIEPGETTEVTAYLCGEPVSR